MDTAILLKLESETILNLNKAIWKLDKPVINYIICRYLNVIFKKSFEKRNSIVQTISYV